VHYNFTRDRKCTKSLFDGLLCISEWLQNSIAVYLLNTFFSNINVLYIYIYIYIWITWDSIVPFDHVPCNSLCEITTCQRTRRHLVSEDRVAGSWRQSAIVTMSTGSLYVISNNYVIVSYRTRDQERGTNDNMVSYVLVLQQWAHWWTQFETVQHADYLCHYYMFVFIRVIYFTVSIV